MKNKYQRLTRSEKKEAIKEYRSVSEKNDNFIHTLNKMFVLGIIGTVYSIVAIAYDFMYPNTKIWNYIVDNIVLVFSIFLIIQRYKFLRISINNYLIDKKDNTKKEEVKEKTKKTKKRK